MRLTTTKEQMFNLVQSVVGVVEKRQTMPILGHILINADVDTVTVVATDMEVEIEASMTLPVRESGSITVPGRKLHDILRSLPNDSEVNLELHGERFIVTSGKSRFELVTLASAEYPRIVANDAELTARLPAANLAQSIGRCQFSMAQQDVRYYLNGMLFEIDTTGALRTVATDGHRLAFARTDLNIDSGNGVRVIVPRKGVLEIGKLVNGAEGEVTIKVNSNYIVAKTQKATLISKLIDGRFPDYDRVIPKDNDRIVLMDTELLRSTLQRAAILANEKYRGVRFEFEPNRLVVEAQNPEREQAREEMDIDYGGESFSIGFNVGYVQEVLQHVESAETEWVMKDETSSGLVKAVGASDYQYVVMPMRL